MFWPDDRVRAKSKRPRALAGGAYGDMLAPAYVPTHEYAVSSAMRRLTSGFGMGPGVPASPWKPTNFFAAAFCGAGAERYQLRGRKGRRRRKQVFDLLVPVS